jgi:hypothetical protein
LTQRLSLPASLTQMVHASNFRSRPKQLSKFSVNSSWGDLAISCTPVFKLLVCFSEPLKNDHRIDGLVTLPASVKPERRGDLYALAINRYNKLVLAEDRVKLQAVKSAMNDRVDVLLGDASNSIASATVSGDFATEFLSRGIDVDLESLSEGAYVRCKLDQTAVVVHRDSDKFWLHWPETLTEYIGLWIESVGTLGRH